LTHAQYRNTVRDLLGETVDVDSALTADATTGRFTNAVDGLLVTGPLGRDYRRTAEALAAKVTGNATALEALVRCSGKYDDACAKTFIDRFGERAFRRPLQPADRDALFALYRLGPTVGPAASAFATGIGLVVEGVLQSPDFLYRVRIDDRPANDARVTTMSDWEVASALSYALWNTMPDGPLFDAARAGTLHTREALQAQVRRLLDDPRSTEVVGDFHGQWMDSGSFFDVHRDPKLSPDFAALSGTTLQQEAALFAQAVFSSGGGVRELLSAPFTFVDEHLAAIYGKSPPAGTGMRRLDLDPAVRGGLLTQVGFLASRAHYNSTSPILRGAYVLKRVLCAAPPPPPPGVDTNLPPLPPGATTRDLVTQQTSPSMCTACHGTINPLGFAFEGFDPVGQRRTMDNGRPVDATGETNTLGDPVRFDGPTKLVAAIAQSAQAQSCYGNAWYAYLMARDVDASESCAVDALLASSGSARARDLVATIVLDRSFLAPSWAQKEAP
jgi:hypothetical protein